MDEDVYLIHPGISEVVQKAAVLSALSPVPAFGADELPWQQQFSLWRWPLLQADAQTCCKDAATFSSSCGCFVALGNALSLLFSKPNPADSFTAASGPSSVFSSVHCRGGRACSSGFWVFRVYFRLVSMSAHLLFFILGHFKSFPWLHFLLCSFSCYPTSPRYLDAQKNHFLMSGCPCLRPQLVSAGTLVSSHPVSHPVLPLWQP